MNKFLILVVTTANFTFWAHAQSDVRIVNGQRVDLAPLNQWLSKKSGDRPLAAWRQIEMLSIEPGQSFSKCTVNIDGLRKDIVLLNCSKEKVGYLTELKRLNDRVVQLKAAIEEMAPKLRELSAKAASDPYGSTDAYNALNVRYQNAKDELSEINEKIRDMNKQAAVFRRELAINTGRKYSNLEIWDCGSK